MVTRDLDRLIAQLEVDSSLFLPNNLRMRMEVLEELDACFGDTYLQESTALAERTGILERANEIRNRLEASNAEIYQSIRNQIQQGDSPARLLRSIQECRGAQESPAPGLGYDHLDELISGVLQLQEPENVPIPGPEMVFYQPTPVRHILCMIQVSALSSDDTFVDLGSGLGHVPILVSILTGSRSVGIESEREYVASARDCVRSLGLKGVNFIHHDARDADLPSGTVFYLYTPFTGDLLNAVLRKLQKESAGRAITVCTLGPCTLTVAKVPWLKSPSTPDPNQVTVFRSNG